MSKGQVGRGSRGDRRSPSRRIRIAGLRRKLGAVTIFFVFLWGHSIAATLPPPPLGLDITGSSYAVVSNGGWQVSTDGGAHFGPARQVVLIRAATPGATSALDRQNYADIWASTCVASQQKLIFRRTFDLPGPAKTFGAGFAANTFMGGIDN